MSYAANIYEYLFIERALLLNCEIHHNIRALQTENHINTSSRNFYRPLLFLTPNRVKALKAQVIPSYSYIVILLIASYCFLVIVILILYYIDIDFSRELKQL